ncbi:alpha-hydroxy acid oxidase [Agromyces aerolatus]|uniref:alpha-hydroxy acid oxidase n=1 Tax=Agromyces sp. LY-1074 TaxID=3074080 RepID=UPI00285E0693|nr:MULTISPECIES: alpha-hydroxy acid oxidase [unclassified Agromyces]MDR5701590.1 alpha-hydroxy acid oxidase [Agromyces sp. LY-1074]MDR5706120.1 alpha-hydroxy acid oxidase [Agromyces sp. LY-1358]
MLLSLADYAADAAYLLDPDVAAFVESGAGGSRAVRRNLEAFQRHVLIPRRFVDVSRISTETTVLGAVVSSPVLIAPTGLQQLAHPDGEVATARAAARAGTVAPAAVLATHPLERIVEAAAGAPVWFQLYDYGRAHTEGLLERAEAAGCAAVCVTIDVPRRARMREHDRRNGFRPSSRVQLAHFPDGAPEVRPVLRATLEWICATTSLPVVVKGVLRADDAATAVEAGASGVVVSNHGGRESGSAPAAVDVLPEVVDAIGARAEVYLDGGVRTGDDVAKALALGARAVMIGRPTWWGLAVAGEDGVADVLSILREELVETLAQLGCPDVRALDRGYVRNEGAR